MSGEGEAEMASWEATITELYQLYSACKKRESHLVNKIIQEVKRRNVKFKLIVGDGTTALHWMCFRGNLGMVKLLVEMYGNTEAKDENQRTPLHLACMQGHLEIAQYLYYEQKCNIQCKDKDGWTPIELAGLHHRTDIVKYFDKNGQFPKADFLKLFERISQLYLLFTAYKKRDFHLITESNSHLCVMNVIFVLKSENCFTTLHLMCALGVLDVVKDLIEMYDNVEAKDETGRTPLHIVCERGHIDVAEYLICERGCDKEAKDNQQNTPFLSACWMGQTDMVKHLVSRFECKFDVRNAMGCTPLHAVCTRGYINLVEYLINQCGCDKEDSDNALRITPLFSACLMGQTDTAKCLISKFGCNLDIRDSEERTPLHAACYHGHQELCLYLINECGCSTEVTDVRLWTPLHFACAGGHLEIIMHLVTKCCDIEAKDIKQRTPLHVACENGRIDTVEYLISQCGCDKEARDNQQRTPLLIACEEGQTNTVKCLISKLGCKFDIRDVKGQSPLHIACLYGFLELVQYLISECGCSPKVTDEISQRTALHYACRGGQLEVIKYLANECKCNTEAKDKLNYTPLYLASCVVPSSDGSSIYTEVVPYLILELGCDPEAETLEGASPMTNFYRFGELSTIKLCIKLKKHDPRTWKSYLRPPPSQSMQNNIKQPHSFYPAQSSTFISRSPLQIACAVDGSMDVVKFLVEEYGSDPLEGTKLVGADNTEEAMRLLEIANLVIPSRDTVNAEDIPAFVNRNLPLDQACYAGRLDMLQYLINKCGKAVLYDYCHRLIISACRYGHSEITRYLLKYSTPDVEDSHGNTLLHIATTAKNLKGAYETVKVLIASMANLDQRNPLGETALHTVCKIHPCRPEIIELLLSSGCNFQISNFAGKTSLWITANPEVFKVFMQYSPADVCERILSDDINEEQSLELLHCLIQQYNWNPNDSTINGDTALHLACKSDRLSIVKYLFSVDAFKYDPYAKNKLNQTPIELTSSEEIIRELIKWGINPIDLINNLVMDENQVLQLVKEINKEKLNGTTANDNTALHLACLTDRVTVVKYLLKESKIDVNAKNVINISPIQLTKNSEIITELIRHGANPTNLYNYCRKVLGESKLLETTVKVFVLGDTDAGKSTLVSSLKKEGWFNFFTNWSSTVNTAADNAEPDHGIITHDFKSKQCGQITLYDFVGKRLFHESQSDLLRETSHSPRVFIIVINLSGSVEETISSLQYWLGFLEEMSLPYSEFKNHTIIVGSNMDKCRKDEMRKVGIFLQKRVCNIPSMDYHDFIALDCRSHSSSNITKLRRCLAKLCVIARNPQSLAFNGHCFQVYLMDKFKGKVAVSVYEILNKMREEEEGVDENDPLNFLPQSDFQLQNLCFELHNKSQVLCLRDPTVNEMDFENSWLVINKAVLISHLLEAFESTTFKTLPSNNGILSFSIISDLEPFKLYNSNMFIRFLCHLEYCKEISDQETLQAITNSIHMNLASERCFFFPVLVENSAPEGVWGGDTDKFNYHCGWMLQCTKPEQFFSSKFLQTLILRVMFCNSYLGPSGASIPTLLKCSIWKGGITWGNIFGAESIVEVLPNNKAVVFLMRCRDANVAKCMEHRSTIIHQIRKCAKDFCGTLKARESLILPSLVKKYPICSIPSKLLFDIEPLVFAVVNITSVEQPYASSLTGMNTIPIRDLLKFEPYFELSALIIQEICNINNPRCISRLTDDFLLRFAQQIRNNSIFIGMITHILNNYCIMDTNVDNLLNKLVEWRDTCNITYQQLHKCIDRFSIFAGLNILDMVPGLAIEEFSTPPSSPVLDTQTLRTIISDSNDSNIAKATPSPNTLHDIPQQLRDKPKLQDLDLLKLIDGSEIRIIEGVASKWEKLAIKFGFEETRICNIRRGAFFQLEDACFNMFIRWLNGEHGLKPPTWYNLIQCLEEINEFKYLARGVKEALIVPSENS